MKENDERMEATECSDHDKITGRPDRDRNAMLAKVMETLQQLTSRVNELSSGFEGIVSQMAPSVASPAALPLLAAVPAIIILTMIYRRDFTISFPVFISFTHPQLLTLPSSKIAFISGLLSDRAAAWALAITETILTLAQVSKLLQRKCLRCLTIPSDGGRL